MPSFIRRVVNDARQNKPSIAVNPADDRADPETAEIINGLVRNIRVVGDADIATDTAIESAVSNGFGYFRIDITEDEDEVRTSPLSGSSTRSRSMATRTARRRIPRIGTPALLSR